MHRSTNVHTPPLQLSDQLTPDERAAVLKARRDIASKFIRGRGLEVGAGSRPFPYPASAQVSYGDIREKKSLEKYFQATEVRVGKYVNAQTFAGIENDSLDFVISAHVIEHLRDPIGSIINAIRVVKPGGIHLLVVPDMRYTFDRHRPETTLDHTLADYADGGTSSCRASYEEHLRYVHPYLTGENYPEAEIQRQADENVKRWEEFDVHFHAWTREGFETLLAATRKFALFTIEDALSVGNENIFVLRKCAQ
jgi:SAM-dependent methyltransferase